MPAKPEIVPDVHVVRTDLGRWAERFRRGGYVAISFGPVKIPQNRDRTKAALPNSTALLEPNL